MTSPSGDAPGDDPSFISTHAAILADRSKTMAERFRSLFALRNRACPASIDAIAAVFSDPSALLKHELAFCLGQMQLSYANKALKEVLLDQSQPPIVRHEAAEALGAIGTKESLQLIEDLHRADDIPVEVRETCELASMRIRYYADPESRRDRISKNPYNSHDPAPPAPVFLLPARLDLGDKTRTLADEDTVELGATLCNPGESLWTRYRAMFALRNAGGPMAVECLAKALPCPSSALFRHEVAYVLGQIQSPLAIAALQERVSDATEHSMVRHEAAEALGSIGDVQCISFLRRFLKDADDVLRESCEVALDMAAHDRSA